MEVRLRWLIVAYVLASVDCRNSLLPVPPNRVVDVNATCSAHNLNTVVTMERPFKGLVFAKDFAQECQSQGILDQIVSLSLPSSGCGIRLTSDADSPDSLYYTVTLVIQMDRYLRQITDQERTVNCYLNNEDIKLKSLPMKNALMEAMKKDSRTGRMKSEWSTKHDLEYIEMQMLDQAKAWMEISSDTDEDKYVDDGTVQVGQMMSLTVKSTLPANIGWNVIDCYAHDGIGDSSQKLLDENGCPIDELILPALEMMPPKMIGPSTNSDTNDRKRRDVRRVSRTVVKKTGEELKDYNADDDIAYMRYQEATVNFPAFKFPDRDRLHFNCGLQLCKGKCRKTECTSFNRTSRHLSGDESDEIEDKPSSAPLVKELQQNEVLDRLEVFNSVEVIAPGIELDDYRTKTRVGISDKDSLHTKLTAIPGDRTFCVSTNKMAAAFCVLGVIFIIAVLVAIFSLLRARRKDGRSYYSRSVFSSSTGSGSGYGGSKLLLHETPCFNTRTWQYGRVY